MPYELILNAKGLDIEWTAQDLERDLSALTALQRCRIELIRPDDSQDRLEMLLELFENEGALAEFRTFCRACGYPEGVDLQTSDAAWAFACYKWGIDLLSITLPSDAEAATDAFRMIVHFARARRLVVHDPQSCADVDLEAPGPLPLLFSPSIARR
jgi:hypothetical protein